MEKLKITPGKWNLNYPYIWVNNNHDTYRFHLSIDTCSWLDSGTYTSKEELQANARLIAAAPQLLEACMFTLQRLELPHESIDWDIVKQKLVASIHAAASGGKGEGNAS